MSPTTYDPVATGTAGIDATSIAIGLGFIPVGGLLENNFNYSEPKFDSSQTIKIEPEYRLVGEKLSYISDEISNEIETMNSLINLGNIIFKNSSNLTAEESAALKLYRKNKYKRF